MNSNLAIKSLLIFCVFSGLGLIIILMANDFSNNKPTEESYLKSDYYAETKKSYEDAMTIYDGNVHAAQFFSGLMPFIGILAAISYYVINKKESEKIHES